EEVRLQGDGRLAQLLQGRLVLPRVAPGDGHARAGARQARGHAQADAAVAAGDQRRFPAQVEGFHGAHYQILDKSKYLAGAWAPCATSRPCAASTASIRAASAC